MTDEVITDDTLVWVLTVDWCRMGRRGVFCSNCGDINMSRTQHTRDEMDRYIGAFWLVLDPQSVQMTVGELKRHNQYVPLGEYSHMWGIGLTPEQCAEKESDQ